MLIASTLTLWLAAAQPAFAAEVTLRDRVLDLVSGYEDAPTRDELFKLGDGVDLALIDIANDASVGRTRRSSAVWALGFFPTDTTHTYVLGVVQDAQADSLLRRSATWALCTGWGDAALSEVAPSLKSDDAQLRNQAVRAVAKVGTPAALVTLQQRLPLESSAMVRDTLNASIQAIGAPATGEIK
ncbi:MAG: HEAT repeat domain-containing protein [Myxococcales bacterium]|nr:HEAT repeat domain-containing protein [Myxococcales bacterium]